MGIEMIFFCFFFCRCVLDRYLNFFEKNRARFNMGFPILKFKKIFILGYPVLKIGNTQTQTGTPKGISGLLDSGRILPCGLFYMWTFDEDTNDYFLLLFFLYFY